MSAQSKYHEHNQLRWPHDQRTSDFDIALSSPHEFIKFCDLYNVITNNIMRNRSCEKEASSLDPSAQLHPADNVRSAEERRGARNQMPALLNCV